VPAIRASGVKGNFRVKPVRILLVLAALSLAACHQEKQPDAGTVTRSASGLEVSDGYIQLPFLPMRPGAAYFVVTNKGEKAVSLTGVSIDGAKKAEIHRTDGDSMASVEQIAMAPGASVRFEPGGLHVMVFDLDPGLPERASTNLTLIFADGDRVTAPIKIRTFHGDPDLDYGGGMPMPGMHDGTKR
jgi:hypothetical protein